MSSLGMFSWYGYVLPIQQRFEQIAQAGFTVTTIWMWETPDLFYEGSLAAEAEQARSLGLTVENVHLPYTNANDWWADAQTVQRIYDLNCGWIDQTAHAHIPIAVLHPERGAEPPAITSQGLDALERLREYAHARGVVIAIENLMRIEYTDELLRSLPEMGFCYDSSHAASYQQRSLELIERHGSRIKCLHLSDSFGKLDDHMLPGLAAIDWKILMSTIAHSGYRGNLTLEAYPSGDMPKDEAHAPVYLDQAYRAAAAIRALFMD